MRQPLILLTALFIITCVVIWFGRGHEPPVRTYNSRLIEGTSKPEIPDHESYLSFFAVGDIRRRVRNYLKGQDYRAGIHLSTFTRDARDAGLELIESIPYRWGVSPQWYVVFRRFI